MDMALEKLALKECNGPKKDCLNFLNSSVLALTATKRGKRKDSWKSQRDAVQRLKKLEQLAYKMSRITCLSSNDTLVTIDKDLYRKCASDNQAKFFTKRKADRAGNTADRTYDSLLRIKLGGPSPS